MITIPPSKYDLSPLSVKNTQLVENELERILNSRHFISALQMQKFLKYIVLKTLFGRKELLKQYTIAVEGLGLPDSFNSEENPLIRIVAGRVRKKLETYYENEGLNDPIIISIPKGSYIPTFENAKKPASSNKNELENTSCGPKLALICFSDKTQNKTSNRLLFQVTDTLAKEFSHFLFTRLVVSIPHADKSKSSRLEEQMKTKHDADFTLSLYVHQLPQQKHELLYRLFDAKSEEVISSESYEIDNEIAIGEQKEVLSKITANIADIQQGLLYIHWARKLLSSRNPVPEPYQVLVYYRNYSDDLGRGAFVKGVDACEKALSRNSKDIVANLVYSDYCRREYVYNYGVIESPLTKGRESAETAVSLRADSHEAHFALAQILFCLDEWDACSNELHTARSICQYHAVIEYGAGFYLYLMGQRKEGLALANKVLSLSVSFPTWFHLTPFLEYYRTKRYAEALVEAHKIVSKNLLHGPLSRCIAYSQLGEQKKAQRELQEVISRYPHFMSDGKQMLRHFFGSQELTDKVWDGVIKVNKPKKVSQ